MNSIYAGNREGMKIKAGPIHMAARDIFDFLIMFGFVFEQVIGFGLTTRRIAVAWAIFYTIIKKYSIKNFYSTKKFAFLSGCFFACMVMIGCNELIYSDYYRNDNAYLYIRYIVYLLLYLYVFASYTVARFQSINDFCHIYIFVLLFQSILIFAAFFNHDFNQFLFDISMSMDGWGEDMVTAVQEGTRIVGFGLIASQGSLILCSGNMLLVYLVIKKQISDREFLIKFFIIMAATMLIARTGLYLEILLLFIYLVMDRRWNRFVWFVPISIAGVFTYLLAASHLEASDRTYFRNWIWEIFIPERRGRTILALANAKVPSFSRYMVFGTNVTRGELPNGEILLSDTGYFKIYCAIGVVGFVLFYGAILFSFLFLIKKIFNRKVKTYLMLCVALNFIIEYKEPYFLKFIVAFVTLVMIMFELRDQDADY